MARVGFGCVTSERRESTTALTGSGLAETRRCERCAKDSGPRHASEPSDDPTLISDGIFMLVVIIVLVGVDGVIWS